MKVALVHDYLISYGGAEKVLEVLSEMYPEAPIYVSISRLNGPFLKEKFGKKKIIQSWFGYLPGAEKLISPLRFLLPLIWASFNFDKYDLVISSASWAVAKGFGKGSGGDKGGRGTKEICYCHTPPRYLYGYETSRNWKKHWYVRAYATIVNHFMRLYDFKRAQNVTQFVANSRETQRRIEKFYRRDSEIIYPPVDVESVKRIAESVKRKNRGDYHLTGGRLEGAKNFDLIIKACKELKVPLKVFGQGTQVEALKKMGGPSVEFLGTVSEEEKYQLMAGAGAFIVASKDEDFGITPVEAMAAGCPVVAYKGGGYQETVVEGKTGVFFEEYTVESLMKSIKSIKSMKINEKDLQKQAEKFSKERFVNEIRSLIGELRELGSLRD